MTLTDRPALMIRACDHLLTKPPDKGEVEYLIDLMERWYREKRITLGYLRAVAEQVAGKEWVKTADVALFQIAKKLLRLEEP